VVEHRNRLLPIVNGMTSPRTEEVCAKVSRGEASKLRRMEDSILM